MGSKTLWSDKAKRAYELLLEDANLDKAEVREFTVTFPMRGLISYKVDGVMTLDRVPPNLDMGVQTCP